MLKVKRGTTYTFRVMAGKLTHHSLYGLEGGKWERDTIGSN